MQLWILETGTKHIKESRFIQETSKMMKYLQFLQHKIGNIDVQKDFAKLQKLINPKINLVNWDEWKLIQLLKENRYDKCIKSTI